MSEYNNVTVIFCKINNFSEILQQLPPIQIVMLLNTVYNAFDRICKNNFVYKVESVAEIYMAVAGCPNKCNNHASLATNCAIAMQAEMDEINNQLVAEIGNEFPFRVIYIITITCERVKCSYEREKCNYSQRTFFRIKSWRRSSCKKQSSRVVAKNVLRSSYISLARSCVSCAPSHINSIFF